MEEYRCKNKPSNVMKKPHIFFPVGFKVKFIRLKSIFVLWMAITISLHPRKTWIQDRLRSQRKKKKTN